MTMMQFSIPGQVPKLLDGRKKQTTRLKGKRKINVGDILHCYFKPRVGRWCRNCINPDCNYSVLGNSEYIPEIVCSDHTNYFGTATVTEITPIKEALENDSHQWAIDDGFESWDEAYEWFEERIGDPNWEDYPLVVIKFEPDWEVA